MTLLDIREGDLLTVGATTYLVRAVGEWSQEIQGMAPRFALRATTTFSTKRPPAVAAGKRGEPAAYLSGQKCLPVMPADSRVLDRGNVQGEGLAGFFELKVTYAGGLEIILEDTK